MWRVILSEDGPYRCPSESKEPALDFVGGQFDGSGSVANQKGIPIERERG